MAKKKKNKSENSKNYIFWILILSFVLVVFFSIFMKDYNKKKKVTTEESVLETFITIDLDKTIEKINNKDQFILYIGSETCPTCRTFSTNLKKVQQKLKFTSFYLSLQSIDRNSEKWKKFTKILSIEKTLNLVNDEKEVKKVTDTIGNFLTNKGYTPTILAFRNGELIDGNIGGTSEKNLENWVAEVNLKF